MNYSHDFQKSAHRHFRAAQELITIASGGAQPGCKAVAGYLLGLAGESAIKQIMLNSGMRPDPNRSPGCPFWAHFPKLRTLLLNNLSGRKSDTLRKFAEDDGFFRNWEISMRYAPHHQITDGNIQTWVLNARAAREGMSL